MNLWKSMEGTIKVELTGAEPERTLRIINEQGIRLYRIQRSGELTVWFRCARQDRNAIHKICQKRGDNVSFSEEQGIFWLVADFFRRPVLAISLAVLFFLTIFLPTTVLFYQVEGNERIPEQQILEAAQKCGIQFGAARREVRSERMKNALLSTMPELQWAGINTSGCTGIISVRERQPESETVVSSGIRHIVAARDGYITDCTVVQGSAMCEPGQVVREGQILVSGYTDCGICVKVSDAIGEIMAQTDRRFCGWTPDQMEVRHGSSDARSRYSLILGKKRINLWKGSGISTATCGRMYEEYCMTLPGGFQLPVKLAVETLTDSTISVEPVSEEKISVSFMAFARSSVLNQMVAGSILRDEQQIVQGSGRFELNGRFSCQEMIGMVIREEIGETNGKND